MGLYSGRIKNLMEKKTRKCDGSTEELEARAERFARDATAIVVRLKQVGEASIQLPKELAYSLLRRRLATVCADLQIIPDLVISDEDLQNDSELEAELWGSVAA